MHGRKKVAVTDLEKEQARKTAVLKKIKAYNAQVDAVMAARKAGKLDVEALKMTAGVLKTNCDFYSLWNYRRLIVQELIEKESDEENIKAMMSVELDMAQMGIMQNPKSYWAWTHRLWAAERMPGNNWGMEVKLCTKMLDLDSRNFHCWGYRREAVRRAGVTAEQELEYTLGKINQNFSNYSAWHYRSNLLPAVHTSPEAFAAALKEELSKVKDAFYTEPDDQSAWLYYRWLLHLVPSRVVVQGMYLVKGGPPSSACNHTAIVCFSQRVKAAGSGLSASGASGAWEPWPSEEAYASVWVCPVEVTGSAVVQVAFSPADEVISKEGKGAETSHQASFTCNADGTISSTSSARPLSSGKLYSDADRDVLATEAANTGELLEIEPDSKWALLTQAFIWTALGRSVDDVAPVLETLRGLDKPHSAYYDDLLSKHIMESAIVTSMDINALDMKERGLTALYCTDLLAPTRCLNLADNRLRSVAGVEMLYALQELCLDGNCLERLDGIGCLPHLQTLSVRRNNLKIMASLAGLRGASVATLRIEGNDVASAVTAAALVALVPTLTSCDQPAV